MTPRFGVPGAAGQSPARELLALLLLSLLSWAAAASAQDLSPLAAELRRRVESGCSPISSSAGVSIVCAGAELQALYAKRGFAPAWTGVVGALPAAQSLARCLAAASEHGLRADDYHLDAIRERLAAPAGRGEGGGPEAIEGLAELEILLSDAFLLYGAHLLAGRVDPETIHPDWLANPRTAGVVGALERAIATGRPEEELAALAPRHPEYARLVEALSSYRRHAEREWPSISDGPVLLLGDAGPRVAELRARLLAEEYGVGAGDESLFDRALEAAVREAQGRHGLEADGVVGPRTLEALNVSAAERVRQLEVNLERWRWMPQNLGRRHIRIDVASFRLRVVDGDQPVLSMAVVVGKPYTRTPTFSSLLTRLVLNPSWNVPLSVAASDLFPEAQRDPRYLIRNGFRVFRGSGNAEVDPRTVRWAGLSPERLGLRFRQAPGSKNALGRVKFLLPNRFDVYLHDTPRRGLFARARRAFSHGCIRLERPLDLAEYLLRGSPRWPRKALERALRSGREQTVLLPEAVPVHILYATAWVAEDGTVHFGEDLYGRDEAVAEALEAPAPGGGALEPTPPPADPTSNPDPPGAAD